jgi:hypothetical protein
VFSICVGQKPKRRKSSKKERREEKKKDKKAEKKAKKKKKKDHEISSSDSSSDSDHGHGAMRRTGSPIPEDPLSEEDGEWEDLEDDYEPDAALVAALNKEIEDAKRTGPRFKKRLKRVLLELLDVSNKPR